MWFWYEYKKNLNFRVSTPFNDVELEDVHAKQFKCDYEIKRGYYGFMT